MTRMVKSEPCLNTMNTPFRLGIDLGGTKIEAILFDPAGTVLLRERRPTPRQTTDDYQAILTAVHDHIRQAAQAVPAGQTYTIGVGIPGIIDPASQRVINANTTSLRGNPFKADLEKLLGRPLAMDNDANCFALAESRSGAARGFKTVFGIILGTGCGGGLCLDGQVFKGRHGIAGEWGHFAIDAAGRKCFCGNTGCVETLISGTGVSAHYKELYGDHKPVQAIVDGARRGDRQCRVVFDQFLENFGRCVGGLISILDPDAIVVGGGLSNIDELYAEGFEQVRRYVFHRDLQTPILKHKLGDSAGVYGAAWIGI